MVHSSENRPNIDELLLRSITRWAAGLSALIVFFDVAYVRGYPFPLDSHAVRGAFYTAGAVALLLATAFTTFLGYRIVSTRFTRRRLSVFLVFLPFVVGVSSLLAALFLAAPA